MTMSKTDPGIFIDNNDNNRIKYEQDQTPPIKPTQQVTSEPRLLSKTEEIIIRQINNCLRNWYKPWKKTFLADGREFKIVYDLMEGLLHYEYQITNSNIVLSNDRTNAIAQAVARLVDYGNAILNIDLIIRANDETSSEIEPVNVTTIELYQAHLKAHNLREKLLYDYFKKDKPSSAAGMINGHDATSLTNVTLPLVTLQVPLVSNQSMNQSPTLERSHRSSIGSNSSINTSSDGRRTPQNVRTSPSPIQIDLKSTSDLSSQIETTHMMATIRSSAFLSSHNSATRITLLPRILSKIKNLLSVPTNAEKIFNCFELLDALFDSVERLPNESRTKEVVIISTALLGPIVRKVYIDDRDNLVEFQHAHWATCLLNIIRLMTAADFNTYLKHFNNLTDLGAFLKDYLFIVKRLTSTGDRLSSPLLLDIETVNNSGPTYPDCWIEMTLLSCSTFLTSLTYLYQVLRQYFCSNLQMWLSFIDCLVHFILQDTLRPDRCMLKERQRLLADDLRQTSAEYVWISWDSLTHDQKQQLLEDLIEPLLRACMTLYAKQRSILLPIFYDMMRCDYTSQYITPHSSLCGSTSSTLNSRRDLHNDLMYEDDIESLPPICHSNATRSSKTNESLPYLSCRENNEDGTVLTKFTHLIVGKLNSLMIDFSLGDESFKNQLCAAISGELNPKYYNRNSFSSSSDINQFKCMAKHTSDLIAEFIQICLDSRQANRLSYKHLYLLCLFKLILFFKDKVDRTELYLNNLYKLCYLHHTAARYVEAGYTLLEHAKTLPWSNKPLENHYRIISRFFNTPPQLSDYTSLKIFLYSTIIEYFDQGQIWEAAVPLCRELIDIYEFKTYEYDKLAHILQKMSAFFNNIIDIGNRNSPEYFRVTFYGIGFPSSIRNATMVYRGKPYEKLGDFQATMLNKYPDVKLLNSLAKPDESILNELDARYLQINACSPVVDLRSKFGLDLLKVKESILHYYRHNECDKFNFSRRISRPSRLLGTTSEQGSEENFANMWRERTTLTTNTLPGILPFFPVFLIETNIVSPIISAIEDLERTNDRLSCMVNRFRTDKRQAEDVRLLGQLLLGVVDAAVNGGITKYEEAFFNSRPPPPPPPPQSLSIKAATNLESNFGSLYVSPDGQHKQTVNNSQILIDLPSAEEWSNAGAQVDKLKCLIAQQVPLLDEAIRLHRDRVADVMRPQHEHLEASYKKLKHHVMTKYYRYLPPDYSRSTIRSYRCLARSPNRSVRSESRLPLMVVSNGSRFTAKRMSDAGPKLTELSSNNSNIANTTTTTSTSTTTTTNANASNIPYLQLANERRSLPFLTIDQAFLKRHDIKDAVVDDECQSPSASQLDSGHIETHNVDQSRPIPNPRTSIKCGTVMSQMNDETYVKSPDIRVDSKQLYARLLCDNLSSNLDQFAYDKSDHDDDNGEASLVLNERRKSSDDTDEMKLVSF